MPCKLRLEYPGAIYHVMSRANGKGNIFETDVDRQDFVKTLAETCAKTGFQVPTYCLVRNLVAGRGQFEQRMEGRRAQESDGAEWQALRRGWCLGAPELRPACWKRWSAN